MWAEPNTWSLPDDHPHATTAHRRMHFITPTQGGVRLQAPAAPGSGEPLHKYTVYAIEPSGHMLVGDVTI